MSDPGTVARQVLADPSFRRPEPNAVERVLGWMADRLADLLDRLVGGLGGGSGGVDAVISYGLLALLVGALVFVLLRVARSVNLPVKLAGQTVEVSDHRSASGWRREGAEHEAAGRFDDALRCYHRALVADAVDRGLVTDEPGRTAHRYQLDLEAVAPGVSGSTDELTGLFELALYGGRAATAGDVRRFRELADLVIAGLPAGAR